MGNQANECHGFTLESFNSDLQAKIASKMTTSDLARIRVSFEACALGSSYASLSSHKIMKTGLSL